MIWNMTWPKMTAHETIQEKHTKQNDVTRHSRKNKSWRDRTWCKAVSEKDVYTWQHMLFQNLYICFSINGAFTHVQVRLNYADNKPDAPSQLSLRGLWPPWFPNRISNVDSSDLRTVFNFTSVHLKQARAQLSIICGCSDELCSQTVVSRGVSLAHTVMSTTVSCLLCVYIGLKQLMTSSFLMDR